MPGWVVGPGDREIGSSEENNVMQCQVLGKGQKPGNVLGRDERTGLGDTLHRVMEGGAL